MDYTKGINHRETMLNEKYLLNIVPCKITLVAIDNNRLRPVPKRENIWENKVLWNKLLLVYNVSLTSGEIREQFPWCWNVRYLLIVYTLESERFYFYFYFTFDMVFFDNHNIYTSSVQVNRDSYQSLCRSQLNSLSSSSVFELNCLLFQTSLTVVISFVLSPLNY